MKLKIQREVLLKPLQQVANVVERRQTTPILSNILIRSKQHSISMTGTDLEVEMNVHVPVEQSEPGDITLPARKLMDLCKSLPDNAVIDISIEKDKAIIKSGRSKFSLATMPAIEFPEIEPVEAKTAITIAQQDLKHLIEQTQFAMAQQDVRYYLNGLLLDIQSDAITAVATDGHRLALCRLPIAIKIDSPVQIIVPRKGVTELQRLLEANQETAQLNIGQNHLKVTLPQLTFTTKLIDGKFPDYNQVIPKNANKLLKATRLALHQAFTRIAVLSNEKFRSMRLQLLPNLLKASVHNPEQEVAEEEIEVGYNSDEIEIGFNISYFIDALSAIKSDEVSIHFTDSNHSCLVTSASDDKCQYVIMPMRL